MAMQGHMSVVHGWTSVFFLNVRRLRGDWIFFYGLADCGQPEKIPWKTSGIEPGPWRGQAVRYIRSPTELVWLNRKNKIFQSNGFTTNSFHSNPWMIVVWCDLILCYYILLLGQSAIPFDEPLKPKACWSSRSNRIKCEELILIAAARGDP